MAVVDGGCQCLLARIRRSLWEVPHWLFLAVKRADQPDSGSRFESSYVLIFSHPYLRRLYSQIVSDLGLVAHRTRMAFTTLSRPFLPENGLLGALIYLTLPVCFLGTCLWWSEAIRAKHQTEGPQSPEIFYLTRAYKPEWRLWEIERFLRKMSLSVVATSLSVTYWDSVHLFLLFGILLSSLLLIAICRPYKLHRWNITEAFLLTTALITISLVSMLQANEAHWATDLEAGKVLATVIILLLAVICGNMMFLVTWTCLFAGIWRFYVGTFEVFPLFRGTFFWGP